MVLKLSGISESLHKLLKKRNPAAILLILIPEYGQSNAISIFCFQASWRVFSLVMCKKIGNFVALFDFKRVIEFLRCCKQCGQIYAWLVFKKAIESREQRQNEKRKGR